MTKGPPKPPRPLSGWKVSYTLDGRQRKVRRFRTEQEARRFYTSLFLRARPPTEQAIEPG